MLLEHVDGVLEICSTELARNVDSLFEHDEPDGVAHFREHTHATFELGRPQVAHVLEAIGELLFIPANASESTLPGKRIGAARIEIRV